MKKVVAGILGLVLAVFFLIMALSVQEPSRRLYVSYSESYVGGDAYNYIMEAALVGNEISAARISRAIYLAVAGVLLFLSLAILSNDLQKQEVKILNESIPNRVIPQKPLGGDNQYARKESVTIEEDSNASPPAFHAN